jgi:hypothetical protein
MALVDNLVAYYDLENTTDASGNGNTLTNTGSVAFSAAKKIVAHEIDEKKHKKLIDEAIKEGLNHESR